MHAFTEYNNVTIVLNFHFAGKATPLPHSSIGKHNALRHTFLLPKNRRFSRNYNDGVNREKRPFMFALQSNDMT
jgi:hypothetical protein